MDSDFEEFCVSQKIVNWRLCECCYYDRVCVITRYLFVNVTFYIGIRDFRIGIFNFIFGMCEWII